jgi:Glycine-zipper domain
MSHQGGSPGRTRFALQLAVAALATGVAAVIASAQSSGLTIYPAKGQAQAQQDQDKYECHQWAVSQSGFDPSNPPAATSSTAPQQQRGQGVRGAARGAALGAVGGAVAGDAGTGAAAGAAMGGVAGGMRRRAARRQERQQQAEGQAASSSGQDAYNRALKTCLQGRGYTVN